MKVTTSSDDFVQVRPSKFHELKNIMETPNRFAFYTFGINRPYGLEPGTPEALRPKKLKATSLLTFTNMEVFALLSKSISIVDSTPEYTEYQLNKVFSIQTDKKFNTTPPGTVRIFSNTLMCFYDGKSWRKISRP